MKNNLKRSLCVFLIAILVLCNAVGCTTQAGTPLSGETNISDDAIVEANTNVTPTPREPSIERDETGDDEQKPSEEDDTEYILTPQSSTYDDRSASNDYALLSARYGWEEDASIFVSAIYPSMSDVIDWPEWMPESVLLDNVYNASCGIGNSTQFNKDLDEHEVDIDMVIEKARETMYYTQCGNYADIEDETERMREFMLPGDEFDAYVAERSTIFADNELVIEGEFVTDRSMVYRDAVGYYRVRGIMFCECTHAKGDTSELNVHPGEQYCAVMEYVIADSNEAAAYYDIDVWSDEPYSVLYSVCFGQLHVASAEEEAILTGYMNN